MLERRENQVTQFRLADRATRVASISRRLGQMMIILTIHKDKILTIWEHVWLGH